MFEERRAVFQKLVLNVTPAQGLSDYIDLYLSAAHRDRRDRGCPVVALSGDIARMTSPAQLRLEAGLQAMTTAVADMLEQLDRPNPEALAASLLFEMIGAVAVSRAINDSTKSLSILESAKVSVKARAGLV